MFDKKNDPVAQQILDQIEDLAKKVSKLRGEHEELGLAAEAAKLRRDIEESKIARDRLKETNDREIREVKHMVGLEKKRAEWEKESAIREARLEVRESAVDEKIQAFTEKLEFVEKQLTDQITYLKDDIVKEVFKRLPVVEVNKTLDFGQNGNSAKAKA